MWTGSTVAGDTSSPHGPTRCDPYSGTDLANTCASTPPVLGSTLVEKMSRAALGSPKSLSCCLGGSRDKSLDLEHAAGARSDRAAIAARAPPTALLTLL